jgi:hypothetical protein
MGNVMSYVGKYPYFNITMELFQNICRQGSVKAMMALVCLGR